MSDKPFLFTSTYQLQDCPYQVKKINGPTCKLTLCDIIIENFGIIFTNILAQNLRVLKKY